MRFGALAERPFRLLWLGRTASAVGDSLVPVALAFAVLHVGGGASGIGFVLASFSGAQIAFLLIGGVWADRLPRRLVMLTCDAIRAAVDVFIAVSLLTGEMRVWMFVVTAGLFGAASAFFLPASTGLVPQTVSNARLQEANALLSLSQSGTRVLGPLVSGVLVAIANPGWVFTVDAVTFVVSASFLSVLRIPGTATARQRFFADLAAGWREVRSRSWLVAGLSAVAFLNLGVAPFMVLGPVIANDSLGGSRSWGLIAGVGALGSVAGGAAALRLRPRRPLVACFALWMLGGLPLLALLPPLPALAVGVALAAFSFGSASGNAIWETVMQRQIPPELRSRVFSFDMLVSICFVPIGQAIAGPIAAAAGMRIALIAGAGMLVVPCLAAMLVPAVRTLEDDGAAIVDEHAVLEMPFDGAGEDDALDVAADPR
jgi:MFS family permease